jgi:hypothetical protein
MTRAIAVAAIVLPLMACGRSSSTTTDAAATTATAAIDAAPVVPRVRAPLTPPPRPPLAPCRAIAASGKILASHEPDGGTRNLATGDAIDSWLDLDAAARVTVKEPRTGRELLFLGPASTVPCVQESEAWLMRGEFQSARGSGESPGAEEWVVTPFAVVRYGAAVVSVKVEADSTRALLKAGGASVLADGGDSWHGLDPAVPLVAKGMGPDDDSDAATDRCSQTSAGAKSLEDQLLAPGETRDPTFGDLAKRTTEARILARAVCAMKAVRAAMRSGGLSLPPPP